MLLSIVWGLIGLLLGVASFVIVPWTLAFLGGVEMRDRVGRWFIDQMTTVMGDLALIAREQGGLALTTVSFDPDFGADKASVAGATGHLADDLNLKSRLSGKPFGIGLESHAVYISPLFAEFAAAASDAVHEGRIGIRSDGGARLDFEIPEVPPVPELRGTHRILDGDAGFQFGQLGNSWAAKSQEKFGKRVSLGQTLVLLGAFALGSGMAILALHVVGDDGGSAGVEVPIQIGLLAMGVGA